MTALFAKPGSARENTASQTTARRRRRGRGEGRSRFCAVTLRPVSSAGLLFENLSHDFLSYTIINRRVSLNLCKMESHPSVPFSPLTTRSHLTTYSTPSSPTYSKNIPVPHQACSKHTTTSYTVRLPLHSYDEIV